MSEAEAAIGPSRGLSRRALTHFLLRRLHSLSGVVPIGAFLVEHFYSNYQAVGPGGHARFDKIVYDLQTNPIIIYLEIGLIGLPLLYHAFYGLFIAGQAKYNTTRYAYRANWRFLVQRVTGIFLVAYIAYHVYMTRFRPVVEPELFTASGGLVTYNYMTGYLNETYAGMPVWVIYVLGVAAAVFHFANGLWGFLIHWGITVGPKAQKISAWACLGLGILLLAVGLNALYAFVEPSAAGAMPALP